MGIAKIWDIVWDSEPFHWTIAFVLGIAIIVEFCTVWHYWRSDCGETKAAIQFLSNCKSNFKKGKNVTVLDKHRRWLNEHLGTDDPKRFRKQDDNFILAKYPTVLARPIPRSSLRFVTTLCTAIGVLGTFYGIQEGLQGISLDTTTSQQLMASSKDLLVGMKTAFSTSLMGLGSGSLFTLILFITESLRQKRRDSLRHRLKAIATVETIDNSNAEVVQTLSRVADQFTGLNQLSAEAIGLAVGEQVRSAIIPALKTTSRTPRKSRTESFRRTYQRFASSST